MRNTHFEESSELVVGSVGSDRESESRRMNERPPLCSDGESCRSTRSTAWSRVSGENSWMSRIFGIDTVNEKTGGRFELSIETKRTISITI
jgi:hypothetical protein